MNGEITERSDGVVDRAPNPRPARVFDVIMKSKASSLSVLPVVSITAPVEAVT